jgi:hypothetical protein
MDIRDTPENAELRRTARRLAREPGPRIVADLDDRERKKRLAEAVHSAGWLELRQGSDGDPLASGVEAAIIAEALGEAVADVPFVGPILAADLAPCGRLARSTAPSSPSPRPDPRGRGDGAGRRTGRSSPSTLPRTVASRRTSWSARRRLPASRLAESDGERRADTRTIRSIPAGAP